MSEATVRHSHGLLCPQCGSPVDVPTGARVVECAHCDQRLYVQGDSGIRRWQIRREIDRDAAAAALDTFYSGMDRARDLRQKAALRDRRGGRRSGIRGASAAAFQPADDPL